MSAVACVRQESEWTKLKKMEKGMTSTWKRSCLCNKRTQLTTGAPSAEGIEAKVSHKEV
jgi:hypothetical protein